MNAPAPGTPDPVIDAGYIRRWLTVATEDVEREAEQLTELDSAIGDADHGANLRRGFTAASAAVEKAPPDSPGAVLALDRADAHQHRRRGVGAVVRHPAAYRGQGSSARTEAATPEQLCAALRAGIERRGPAGRRRAR